MGNLSTWLNEVFPGLVEILYEAYREDNGQDRFVLPNRDQIFPSGMEKYQPSEITDILVYSTPTQILGNYPIFPEGSRGISLPLKWTRTIGQGINVELEARLTVEYHRIMQRGLGILIDNTKVSKQNADKHSIGWHSLEGDTQAELYLRSLLGPGEYQWI